MAKNRTAPAERRSGPFLTAPRIFVGSFLALILLGTLALETIPGLYKGEGLSWLDAIFTSTSAVCVTGLIVCDTATYFTRAGQAVILVLVQLGGLGIITFSTVIILALGRRISLSQEELYSTSSDVTPRIDYRGLAKNVVLFTLFFEGAGTALLYLLWRPALGGPALWHALFQSVSAFCNAGFSTFSDSLIGLRGRTAGLGVVMALVVVGGIGFLVINELALRIRAFARREPYRLSLNTRLVLAVTIILIGGGGALFAFFEWRTALGDLSTAPRVANALFMSVTPRTAGFNTIDYATASDSSILLTMILMFVGGSPGSTAGGVKTTTAALIGLLAWSRLRGRGVTSLWSRSIPEETVQRAVGLTVIACGVLALAVFTYTTTEVGRVVHVSMEGRFVRYVFEAISAFNTVGLSMGATEALSEPGRVLTVLLMFLGRVGPLTFAAAIALRRPTARSEFRYAYEDVVVG